MLEFSEVAGLPGAQPRKRFRKDNVATSACHFSSIHRLIIRYSIALPQLWFIHDNRSASPCTHKSSKLPIHKPCKQENIKPRFTKAIMNGMKTQFGQPNLDEGGKKSDMTIVAAFPLRTYDHRSMFSTNQSRQLS